MKAENGGFQCWDEVRQVDWEPGMQCLVRFKTLFQDHWKFCEGFK